MYNCVCLFTDGQAKFERINRNIKKNEKKITRLVEEYNQSKTFPTASSLPTTLKKEQVLNENLSNVFQDDTSVVALPKDIEDTLYRLDRAKEELQYVAQEMKTFLATLCSEYLETLTVYNNILGETQLDRGKRSRLMVQIILYEMKYKEALSLFQGLGVAVESNMNFFISDVVLASYTRNEEAESDYYTSDSSDDEY